MATAALRLGRRRLLAGPTHFVSTRLEPHINRIPTAAAASPPSPRPTHSGLSIDPYCPPLPCSTASAAISSVHRPPATLSTRSIDTHGALSFSPIHPTRFPVSHRCSVLTQSIGDRFHSRSPVSHRCCTRGRFHSSEEQWRHQRRSFSNVSEVNQLPPVRQLLFGDESELCQEDCVEPIGFLKKHSLLTDARSNPLNAEISDFMKHPQYNFSETVGIPLIKSLVLLALINNNRGYCISRSFSKENMLVCPRLNQFVIKKLVYDNLDSSSSKVRASSYLSAAALIRELLEETVGSDALRYLLEEPRDLFCKMERPSDERLIIYHPSLLSTDGTIWIYEKLYRFFFKIAPFSDEQLKDDADLALREMAYTNGDINILQIINTHPLLLHIDSNQPTGTDSAMKKDWSHVLLGKKVVALPRHTIEHAFDKGSRMVESKSSTEALPKKLWRYSLDQVVDMLKSILPLHLIKEQEAFLRVQIWSNLQIDNFWARDLTWMGGVPPPTDEENVAIRKALSYGKRRQQAKKFDQLQPRNSK